MRDALLLELNREVKGPDGKVQRIARLIAKALIARGLEGDVAAIKEINDRVDGKVAQQITGDKDAPITVVIRNF